MHLKRFVKTEIEINEFFYKKFIVLSFDSGKRALVVTKILNVTVLCYILFEERKIDMNCVNVHTT
jgi:hypothetical protein